MNAYIKLRNLATGAVVVASLLIGGVAHAAAPNWDTTGDYVVEFEYLDGYYAHDMELAQDGGGALTGVGGGYPAGALSHVYTWVIDSGSVDGDTIELVAHYTASADAVTPLTVMVMTGTIDEDGEMSGTWHDNYQGGNRVGEWRTTLGSADDISDLDNDGVEVGDDLCPGTVADVFPSFNDKQAKGRWMFDGTVWKTNAKDGTQGGFLPTMESTYGCSGEQILDALTAATGGDFSGHYKYGITKGLIEDWMAGVYKVETVTVPAADADGVTSLTVLDSDYDYVLRASGTAYACNVDGCVISFDADYSTSDGGTSWDNGVAAPYAIYGEDLLDLKVNGSFVNWGAYNSGHSYEYDLAGGNTPVTLGVYDLHYESNSGNLTVDILVELW
jgi:hypothetical protein